MISNQKTTIGIDKGKIFLLAEKLNVLLANYQVFYQNLRGFHWNIAGPSFFELHLKFEEMYTAANESIDMIAERILTLEARPLHTFSAYLKQAEIKEASDVSTAQATVELAVENLAVLIKLEREILSLSSDAEDEGTNAMMSDYIREQEKLVWMLKAYLKK